MAMEITILDGVEVLAQGFQAISAFVKNDTWFSLIKNCRSDRGCNGCDSLC